MLHADLLHPVPETRCHRSDPVPDSCYGPLVTHSCRTARHSPTLCAGYGEPLRVKASQLLGLAATRTAALAGRITSSSQLVPPPSPSQALDTCSQCIVFAAGVPADLAARAGPGVR